ncbi:sugar transferase [Nocardioides humi]|uniref:Bacterial sugar transferase domain-containing protein n=1 Tax=Nocardioides humi TaxID=449461 RepID=A0ABN2A390_9ACTN|nr:sugar transferase [Nocardioides humi]
MTVISARPTTRAATGRRTAVDVLAPLQRTGRLFVAADAVAAALAVLVASQVPGGVERGATGYLFVPLWVLAVAVTGEYRLTGGFVAHVRRLAAVALVVPTATLLTTEALSYPLSASTVTAVCVGSAALGALARRAAAVPHRVVVVGSSTTLPDLLARIRAARNRRFSVVGACVAAGDPILAADLDAVPTVSGLATCASAARANGADAVILAPDHAIPDDAVRRLRWALEEDGVGIFVWPGLATSPVGRTRLDLWDDVPLLHLGAPRRLGPSHAVKHVLDRAVAALALVVLAPILLALAVAVRLDSPGPAFFRQTRVGRGDAPFTMWKLRTMRQDADTTAVTLADLNEADGPLFKIQRDPRVTRVGRWLRRTSLDELPQLVNVALGQMSLVGPRPALPTEVEDYHPDVRHRLVVRPGMTGLWQVSGRADLSWEESVRLDQQYVDNWSLFLDARILLRTAGAVLGGRGAY